MKGSRCLFWRRRGRERRRADEGRPNVGRTAKRCVGYRRHRQRSLHDVCGAWQLWSRAQPVSAACHPVFALIACTRAKHRERCPAKGFVRTAQGLDHRLVGVLVLFRLRAQVLFARHLGVDWGKGPRRFSDLGAPGPLPPTLSLTVPFRSLFKISAGAFSYFILVKLTCQLLAPPAVIRFSEGCGGAHAWAWQCW